MSNNPASSTSCERITCIAASERRLRASTWPSSLAAPQDLDSSERHQSDLSRDCRDGQQHLWGRHDLLDRRLWLSRHRVGLQNHSIDEMPEADLALSRWLKVDLITAPVEGLTLTLVIQSTTSSLAEHPAPSTRRRALQQPTHSRLRWRRSQGELRSRSRHRHGPSEDHQCRDSRGLIHQPKAQPVPTRTHRHTRDTSRRRLRPGLLIAATIHLHLDGVRELPSALSKPIDDPSHIRANTSRWE